MKIRKIIEISSRDSDEQSKQIKDVINEHWKSMTEKNEAKQFAEAFDLLENENIGRLIITKNQAGWNPAFDIIFKILNEHDANELHYYFHKN